MSDGDIGCMTSLKHISTYKMLETSVMEISKTSMKDNKLHSELCTNPKYRWEKTNKLYSLTCNTQP